MQMKRRFIVTVTIDDAKGSTVRADDRTIRRYIRQAVERHGHTEAGHRQQGDPFDPLVNVWEKMRKVEVTAANTNAIRAQAKRLLVNRLTDPMVQILAE